MSPVRPLKGRSIFFHTLLLVVGVIVALAALNVAVILLRPPPRSAPITAYELARLLQGREIAKQDINVRLATSTAPPVMRRKVEDGLTRDALANFLGRSAEDVRFARFDRRGNFDRLVQREYRLYGPDRQFNPIVFGSFEAAIRLPDGRWRTARRSAGADPVRRWQAVTILWIILSVIVAIPIAWAFSKRLARPIRELALAAGELGHGRRVAPIEASGPAEVEIAGAAFNDMHERIRRYVTERTSVVGAIAHDLRTPLARLQFHLSRAPDELRMKAEAEIRQMEQMIATTMDFVQSETRMQPHEPIDLGLLIEGVVDDFADMGRSATMGTVRRVTVNGDSVLLKRLFANLIENALDYGGSALVAMRVEGRFAVVEIFDEGPGLKSEDLARVFEPFYRAESSRNPATGGMGLGLAIVETAARAHGGVVELLNRARGGLCVRVKLPVA